MDFAYPLTALATVLIALLTFIFSAIVGKLRGQHGINAPAMTGNDAVERAIRVHMNTIEQLVIFLPTLWVFAVLVSDNYALFAATIWMIGRLMYSQGYMQDPSKRSMGFMVGFLTFVVTAIWSLVELFGIIF